MRLVLVTPPAAQPIDLDEAKAQCRIRHDDEDLLIQHYIDAAVAWLDGPAGILGRCLVTQTWRAEFAALPARVLLPFPDTVVDSAVFLDGEEESMAHDLAWHEGRPVLNFASGVGRPASITFTAGYGAPSDVPASLRQALLLLVSHWFDHRHAVGQATTSPFAVEALIAPHRRVRL